MLTEDLGNWPIGFEISLLEAEHTLGHWDNIQAKPESNASGHLIADGTSEAYDLVNTGTKRPLVRSFVEAPKGHRILFEQEIQAAMSTLEQTIVPQLRFDTQALAAAEFYTAIFPDAKINNSAVLENSPSGNADVVSFSLWGQQFEAVSADPHFSFNPAISFIINFDPLFFGICDLANTAARETQDTLWNKLVEGGEILMPLDRYPFSERFGWLKDKYGISWQFILSKPANDQRPAIVPSMLFTGENCGKAEEAVDFYLSVFNQGKRGGTQYYPEGQAPNRAGDVMFSDFQLRDFWLAAIDSGADDGFTFNEAVSFTLYCADQKEIDYFWGKLNANPDGGQCGQIKDKYGLCWQILPSELRR